MSLSGRSKVIYEVVQGYAMDSTNLPLTVNSVNGQIEYASHYNDVEKEKTISFMSTPPFDNKNYRV